MQVPEAGLKPTSLSPKSLQIRLASDFPPEPQFPRMSPSPGKGKLRVSGPTGLLTRLGSKEELFWSPVPQEPELGRSSRPVGRREKVTSPHPALHHRALRLQVVLPPLSRLSGPFLVQPGPGACWASPNSSSVHRHHCQWQVPQTPWHVAQFQVSGSKNPTSYHCWLPIQDLPTMAAAGRALMHTKSPSPSPRAPSSGPALTITIWRWDLCAPSLLTP